MLLNSLRTLFKRPKPEASVAAPLVYSLESPKYQLFELERDNLFSGWVFYFGARVVTAVSARADGMPERVFPVDLPRPDIGAYVPSIPAAQTCGFSFVLPRQADRAGVIHIDVRLDDQSLVPFLIYDVGAIRDQRDRFALYRQRMRDFPAPSPDLVHLTQGHGRVDEYHDSIVPAVLSMRLYLERSGVDLDNLGSLLDFGCGSARLLVGWKVTTPQVRLYGCDLNPQLIEWAQTHLPAEIDCRLSNLQPPLPYRDGQFDLIYLISVFTHLSLATQTQWLAEFKRVLKAGGHLLVTLHGMLYVRNVLYQQPEMIEQFERVGHLEVGQASIEGSNAYCTFHRRDFVERLFSDFELVGFFPNGNDGLVRTPFQIAQAQDVYVLKYRGVAGRDSKPLGSEPASRA